MTQPSTSNPSSAASPAELSLLTFLERMWQTGVTFFRPLRRVWRRTLGTAALAGLLAIGGSYLLRPRYISSVSFFVDRSSQRLNLPAGLGTLGQQLGLGDEQGQPLAFYAWLASSDAVLHATLFDTLPGGARRSFAESAAAGLPWGQLFGDPQPGDTIAEARAVKLLRRRVKASVDLRTSLVTVTAFAPSRPLAMHLARQIFEGVNQANTTTRQTRAGNELRFLRERQEHAAELLQAAEGQLRLFYQQNRSFRDSPSLVFAEERLKRAVDVARESYLSLTRSVQDAELRAVRDIPALTLIQGPTVPLRKAWPRRSLFGIVGALLGFLLAYAYAWGRQIRANSPTSVP